VPTIQATQIVRLVVAATVPQPVVTQAPRLTVATAADGLVLTQAARLAVLEVGSDVWMTQAARLTAIEVGGEPRLTQIPRLTVHRLPSPLSILVNNVEHVTDAKPYSLRIEYQLGARGRAAVDIRDFDSFETAYRPALDQRIEMILDELLFRGTIFSVNDGPMGAPGVGTLTRVGAVDDWARATTRRVTQSYAAGTSLRTVVSDLITVHLGLYQIRLDPTMPEGPPLPAVTFDGVTVEDAFNQLVDLSGGWVYRLRPTGIVEWFEIGTKLRPFTLSAANKNILGAITWTKSRAQFANRVCVRYGTGVAAQSEAWTGDGGTTRYPLTNPPLFPTPDSTGWIGWVTVGGTQEGLGVTDLTAHPWSYDAVENEIVRTSAPTLGVAIAITYNVQYPLVVCADAPEPVGEAAPQWQAYPPRGGRMAPDGGGDTTGYGNNVSDATPPTSVTATVLSGGSLEATFNNEYAFLVTSIDASGRESDPYPFHLHPPTGGGRGAFPSSVSTLYGTQAVPKVTIVPGTNKVRVSWGGATGAVKYRCYIGDWYYRARWHAYLETTGTTVDFISVAASTDATFGGLWWYVVMAQLPEGILSQVSRELSTTTSGPARPSRGWFNPVAGAIGYQVCRRGTMGGFTRMISVPPEQVEAGWVYFEDDFATSGVVITGLPAQVVPWEGIVERADIFDTEEALALAESLVAKANALPRTVTLRTRVATDFLPGDTITLDVPSRTLPNSEWLVTEVEMVAEADQQLTTTLTLLEGLQTQASWLDFWRDIVGAGAGVGIASGAVTPPAEGGGGGGTSGGVVPAGALTVHALLVGQGGAIARALGPPLGPGVLHGVASGDPVFGPVTGSDFAAPLPLAAGGTGQATAPAALAALSPATTKGDLVVHDGTVHVRQPVASTPGQALLADPTTATGLKWGDVAAGGGGSGKSDLVLLEEKTAAGGATLDFTNWLNAAYDDYVIEVVGLLPDTDGAGLKARVSTDGGTTWRTTDYAYALRYTGTNAENDRVNGVAQAEMFILGGNENTPSVASSSATLHLVNPGSATRTKTLRVDGAYMSQNGYHYTINGSCWWANVAAVNGLRFYYTAGNLAEGTIRIYGMRKGTGGGSGGTVGGAVVQVKTYQTGALQVALSSATIPLDNTIPQITEGTEFMSLVFTPRSASNALKIDVVFFCTCSLANWVTVGLFRDAVPDALASFSNYENIAASARNSTFSHTMVTAGTVSPITFRVRAGKDASAAGVVAMNGTSTAGYFGGSLASSITVTEIDPAAIGGAATGNVTGPATSVLNALARYGDTTGKLLSNSGVLVDDTGLLRGPVGLCDYGRTVPLGVWQSIPFNAANFTADAPMTWGVDAADVLNFSYTLIGKTAVIGIGVVASTLGGTATANLYCALPFTPNVTIQAIGRYSVGGTGVFQPLLLYTLAGSPFVGLQPLGGGNFVVGVDNAYFQGSILTALP